MSVKIEPLEIARTEDTPGIYFNPNENTFKIYGRSLPEDVIHFYTPVMEWIVEYLENPNEETCIDFDMEYINSHSMKQIAKVLMTFEKFGEKTDITIRWHYTHPEMLITGKRYLKIINLPFEFIQL